MISNKASFRPNHIFSVLSTALLLFLVLLMSTVWVQSQLFIKDVKENINIVVEFDVTTQEADIKEVEAGLKKMEETISASLQFVDKQSAFEKMVTDFGDDFLNSDFPNPLNDVITINLKEEYMISEEIIRIKKHMSGLNEHISGIYFDEQLLSGSLDNMKKTGYMVFVGIVVMLIVVVTLLHNTVKLSLFSNRFLIKNMSLVGAKSSFIRKPFIRTSLVQGFFAGLLAILLFVALGYYVYTSSPQIINGLHLPSMYIILGATVLLGMIITSITTVFVVNRYLRMKLKDLF